MKKYALLVTCLALWNGCRSDLGTSGTSGTTTETSTTYGATVQSQPPSDTTLQYPQEITTQQSGNNLNLSAADQKLVDEIRASLTNQTTTAGQMILSQDLLNKIQITSSNYVVTLRGSVPDQQQKQALEYRIKSVPGVRQVKNELQIQNQAQGGQRSIQQGQDSSQPDSNLNQNSNASPPNPPSQPQPNNQTNPQP